MGKGDGEMVSQLFENNPYATGPLLANPVTLYKNETLDKSQDYFYTESSIPFLTPTGVQSLAKGALLTSFQIDNLKPF